MVSRAPNRFSSVMRAFPVISFERFNRILHDGDAPSSLQQTFGGEADAVFGDHSEHHELSVIAQPPHQFVCVPAFKNIQRLLFEQGSAGIETSLPAAWRMRHWEHARLWRSAPQGLALLQEFPSRSAEEKS